MTAPKMILGAFFNPTGHHIASWTHPEADADAGINVGHYLRLAQQAEAAKFHLIFLADQLCVRNAPMRAISRSAQYIANFEPLTLLSAMAAVTGRIGLVSTATTSYNEPYHVARKFASLDHISGGRAGWNIVTSAQETEAQNFGRAQHYEHELRYRRAAEFTEVVTGLWDSWDDDAFVRDKQSGQFFTPDGLHQLDHAGEFFKVQGPLNVPRPPQGYPVLVQAGQSDTGRGFAARYAEIIFTGQFNIKSAHAFRDDMRARVAAAGRNPDNLKILPGVSVIVGRTDADAERQFQLLQGKIDIGVALDMLASHVGGFDFSPYDLDAPMPDIPANNATKGAALQVVEFARAENLSLREVALRIASSRHLSVLRGSPERIADQLEQWFAAGACDGFNIMPAYLPGAFTDFATLVIPELQRRGLFQTEYQGHTLRQNLGLPRPPSRYAAGSRPGAVPLDPAWVGGPPTP